MFEKSIKAMEHLNIGLTAREPMASKYLKTGFPIHGFNIHNIYYKRNSEPMKKNDTGQVDFILKPVDSPVYEDVLVYHNSVIKMPGCEFRDVFLKASSHLTAALKDGAIVGYGALQQTRNNWRVSPLHAETKEISEVLLECLVSQIPEGYKAVMSTPEVNKKFVNKVMERNGFQEESEDILKRLYSEREVKLEFSKIISIWNLDSIYP